MKQVKEFYDIVIHLQQIELILLICWLICVLCYLLIYLIYYIFTASSSLASSFSLTGWVRTGGFSRTTPLHILPIISTCTSIPGVSKIRGMYANTRPFPVAGLKQPDVVLPTTYDDMIKQIIIMNFFEAIILYQLEMNYITNVHTLPAIQTERFPSGSAFEPSRSTSIITSF